MKHPLLYEINTRCWLAELATRAGRKLTLASVPEEEFDFWQKSGFTHIWLMGVWQLGRRGRDHSLAGRVSSTPVATMRISRAVPSGALAKAAPSSS